jgi:hypothetical protein
VVVAVEEGPRVVVAGLEAAEEEEEAGEALEEQEEGRAAMRHTAVALRALPEPSTAPRAA